MLTQKHNNKSKNEVGILTSEETLIGQYSISLSMWKEIERFLLDLRPNTQRRYRTVLLDFVKHVGMSWHQAKESDVETYWDMKRSKNYSGKTLRSQYECLRSIFNHLKKRRFRADNPFDTAAIRIPRSNFNRKRQAGLVPFDMVMPFCNMPDPKTKEGVRDRAFLALLFGGALRISEARNLQVGDIKALLTDDSTVTVYVHLRETKAGSPQTQPLANWAAERLLRLVEQRHSEGAQAESPLLTNYVGGDAVGFLNIKTLSRRFHKYRSKVGLPDNITTHSGRVTAASFLIDKKKHIRKVQKFLRHENIQTTETYVQLEETIEGSAAKDVDFC